MRDTPIIHYQKEEEMRRAQSKFNETLVIFFSDEDRRWIAHGLHTDQIGDGDSVIAALEDAIRAVDAVISVAHDDPTVEVLREAPADIQAKARTSTPLPREIYEIAHRRARGDWPDEVPIDVTPKSTASFKTEIGEEALC
jgi:hypothetical protein